jgi:ABC-type branched-subunit amino acid transport system substrate-binding protein
VVILGANADALISILKRRNTSVWAPLFVTVSTGTDYLLDCPKESEGVVVSQVVPFMNPHWPTVNLYHKLLKQYYPNVQLNLSAFEGFLNAMVLVEGLKRAGKDLTRDKFIHALESIHDFDLGVGPSFKLNYSHTNHNGLSANSVYFMTLHDGKVVEAKQADWLLKRNK